ncbi:MAG: ABC transporter substrate-binding protein [Nitrososphaeraceae archaeon]
MVIENSFIFFSSIEEKEHLSHLIIVINSLIAFIIAIFVTFQESLDKSFHLKTRISVTLGLSFWFLANLSWAIYSLVFDIVPPIPSIGDVLWLSAYGFLGYHLFLSFKKFRHKFNKKLIGAGVVVGITFLIIMTFFTLSISTLENFRGISMFIVLLLYPALAALLLVFSIILQIGLRKDTHHAVPWMCDSLGTLAIVIADSWFVIVVLTQNVADLWLSAIFINAHYLIMTGGLIWYSRYLTTKHETGIMTKCYRTLHKRKIMSLTIISVFAFSVIFTIPNPLNPLQNYSHNEHEREIGIVYASTEIEEIPIGVLLPITGTLSSLGESGYNILKITVKDINNYLNDTNSKYRIKLIIENTNTSPDEALKKIKLLKEQYNINTVIGPASSSELMAVRDYANQNDILVIGFASTSPSLSVPGDNIFRIVPDDTNQAKSMSEKMWNDGIKVIIPIYRSDVYGNDLLNFTKTNFQNLGGLVDEGIKYDPPIGQFAASLNRINYVFWGQELIALNSKVEELSKTFPLNEIGVYVIAFDEIIPILSQANSHPLLEQVSWYGNEATTKYEQIVKNYESSIFAKNSDYISPIYGFNETDNKKLESFIEKYDHYEEEAPLTFDGPYLYDSLWLATLAKIDSNNTQNIKELKKTFISLSNIFTGITGLTSLNDAGDRLEAIYEFWTIQTNENNTRLEWIKVN